MSQNIISIVFTPEEKTALDDAVAKLDAALAGKTASLSGDQRQQLMKMGDKSEAFARQAVSTLDKNRQVVPPSMGLDEALADLAALEVIRPVLQRLTQITERLRDTEMALGSDLMSAAVEGYSLLKVTGKQQGLDGLRKELGSRFARTSRKAAVPETEQA